jgi:hypothetical protein
MCCVWGDIDGLGGMQFPVYREAGIEDKLIGLLGSLFNTK